MYLTVENLDRAEEERVAISGLGRQVQKGEIEPITYVDAVMSDRYLFVDDEYGLGFQVSRRQMEDDQYGNSSQNAKWLGRSARLTQEYLGGALLDDAFTGTTYTGLLSEVLCETAHELLNGTATWSNEVAGNPSLSVTGYQAALELGEAQVDHQGDPMPLQLRRLLIDRTDEAVAIQLTQNQQQPFTADRDINAMLKKSQIRDYRLLHYKTADGSWFMQDPNLIDMKFKFRVRPEFGDDTDTGGTLASRYWARQRCMVYFFDQRGIIGSDGTGVA